MGKKKKKEIKITSVYLLKLRSKKGAGKKENFFKIGHAKDVNKRVKQIDKTYDVEIIETLELEHSEALRLEATLKFDWSKYRYWPESKFVGSTEALQNKMFLRAGDVLQPQYDAINTEEIRRNYMIDKAARKQQAKDNYWSRWT